MPDPKYADIERDHNLSLILRKYMLTEHNAENYDFLHDKNGNEVLYTKWISGKEPIINLAHPIKNPLDTMAKAGNFAGMTTHMAEARTAIIKLIDTDIMRRFLASELYKTYKSAHSPELAAAVTKFHTDMTEGTAFFTTAMKTVHDKGLPARKEEVDRMFASGRMRHDKVHTPFTELLQTNKLFTRAHFAHTFQEKDAFSKKWAEYRAVLKR